MSKFNNLYHFFLEDAKWSKGIKVRKGKMRSLLGISQDEKITDKYENTIEGGKKLAKELLDAVGGNKREAASMLAFAANISSKAQVFDKALKAIKEL